MAISCYKCMHFLISNRSNFPSFSIISFTIQIEWYERPTVKYHKHYGECLTTMPWGKIWWLLLHMVQSLGKPCEQLLWPERPWINDMDLSVVFCCYFFFLCLCFSIFGFSFLYVYLCFLLILCFWLSYWAMRSYKLIARYIM